MDIQSLRNKVATANKILYQKGLTVSVRGHASARIPNTEQILIKAGSVSLRNVTSKDVVRVTLSGKQLDGKLPPPLETDMHLVIYQHRPDVGGVVHAHPPTVTAYAVAGEPIKPVFLEGIDGSLLYRPTPIFVEPNIVSTKHLARQLVNKMGKSNAILIRNHGMVAVGRTIEEACVTTIYLEEIAKIQLLASIISRPSVVNQRRAKALLDRLPASRIQLIWEHFCSELS